jgi:nicotinate-nucleotide--dimethylbenzimidazole phosphoribosyltransferase
MTCGDLRGVEIPPVDASLAERVRAHLDDLTKPPGSLGRMEEVALSYCLARGTPRPSLERKRIVVFAADHGVVAEGVSAFPAEVTAQMVRNMLAGGAAINVLSRHVGAELRVVDVGVADPLEGARGLIRRKVRSGTRNFAREPAMLEDEVRGAVGAGLQEAHLAASDAVDLLAAGEMGIGNTTAAAALMAALLPCDPAGVVGRGTGVDDATLERKAAVVSGALRNHSKACATPLGALAAVGGLEIAAMCGLMLGAAQRRIPTVVDGFISSAAALVALRLHPEARDYLVFAHCSAEAGHRPFFGRLGVKPLLDLDMRLGEGTGAALAMSLVEAAVRLYNEMATFSGARVSGRKGPKSPGSEGGVPC